MLFVMTFCLKGPSSSLDCSEISARFSVVLLGGLAKGVDMGGLALSFVDKQINNGYAEGFSVPNKKREDHPDGSSQCSVAARVLMRTPWLRSSHVDRDNC